MRADAQRHGSRIAPPRLARGSYLRRFRRQINRRLFISALIQIGPKLPSNLIGAHHKKNPSLSHWFHCTPRHGGPSVLVRCLLDTLCVHLLPTRKIAFYSSYIIRIRTRESKYYLTLPTPWPILQTKTLPPGENLDNARAGQPKKTARPYGEIQSKTKRTDDIVPVDRFAPVYNSGWLLTACPHPLTNTPLSMTRILPPHNSPPTGNLSPKPARKRSLRKQGFMRKMNIILKTPDAHLHFIFPPSNIDVSRLTMWILLCLQEKRTSSSITIVSP